jgi:prolyl oligopeptidase
LVTAFRDIAKRADAELPMLFAELPRTPYGVRAFPDYEAPSQATAMYYPGASDGSRAGYFMVNTYRLDMRPKYEMEALTLHETVPGHHLQIARAHELHHLPDFRRNGSYTAFIEGWALYAESLGASMGFYADLYSKFGQLIYEMWRACRLVVDTGLHCFGWTRQQAIDYMQENTAKTEQDIAVEVDRYIVMPGQALAYKIGELAIKELRAKAESILGPAFDIRKFHNAILDNGPLPLTLLNKQIEEWINAQT